MGFKLFDGVIVLKSEIWHASVNELAANGFDGKKYEITLSRKGSESLQKTISVSGTALAEMAFPKQELVRRFVQLYDRLPHYIHSDNLSILEYPQQNPVKRLRDVGGIVRTYFQENPSSELHVSVIRNSLPIEESDLNAALYYFRTNNVITTHDQADTVFPAQGWQTALNRLLEDLERQLTVVGTLSVESPRAVATGEGRVEDRRQQNAASFCRHKVSGNEPCNRQIEKDHSCIFHLAENSEKRDRFQAAFDELSENDFTGFLFPEGFVLRRRIFTSKAIFDKCVFVCPLDFSGGRFHSDVVLKGCNIEKELNLSGVVFEGDVDIIDLTGGPCSFRDSRFKSGLRLRMRHSAVGELCDVEFEGAIFESPNSVVFGELYLPKLYFKNCNVSTVTFRGFRASNADYARDSGKVRKTLVTELYVGNEGRLPTELAGFKDFRLRKEVYSSVVEIYQGLQRSTLNSKQYSEAGSFYYREMEIRRWSETYFLGRVSGVTALYKWFSLYGESYWLPLVWVIGVIGGISVITLYCMGSCYFVHSGAWGDLWTGTKLWLGDVASNLRCLFSFSNDLYAKHGEFTDIWYILLSVERVLILVLVSLFVVAMRRKYRRY